MQLFCRSLKLVCYNSELDPDDFWKGCYIMLEVHLGLKQRHFYHNLISNSRLSPFRLFRHTTNIVNTSTTEPFKLLAHSITITSEAKTRGGNMYNIVTSISSITDTRQILSVIFSLLLLLLQILYKFLSDIRDVSS